MDKKKIGDFIRRQRKIIGITQEEFASKMYTTRENISKWERGISIPNTEYLKRMCEVLECNVIDLLSAGESDAELTPDQLFYEIIGKQEEKIKRIITIFLTAIVFLIVNFLAYYFTQTYKSIKLYRINGEDGSYGINDTILLVNKDKYYFIFNGVNVPKDEEVKKVKIYYYDKFDDEQIIYCSGETPKLIVNNKKSIDFDKMLNSLNIEIVTDKNIKMFSLDVRVEYSNDELFSNGYVYTDDDYDNLNVLPSFIDDRFVYDYDSNIYIYEYLQDESNVKVSYDNNTKNVYMNIRNDKEEFSFSYSLLIDGVVSYIDNDKETYFYDYSNKKCLSKNCNSDIAKKIDNYLKKYDFLIE